MANSFEESCSTCHLKDILGESRADAKGIAVLVIPELDVKTLTDKGFNIGEWPKWAEGNVTPFMSELLMLKTKLPRTAL